MRTIPFFVLLAPSILFADEVYLKGAGTISGRIVEQTETTITIDVGGGTVGVPVARVERVEKKRSPLDDYDERAAALGPRDAGGWLQLGRWASKQGLSAQSREAFETVLTIDLNDEEARAALGYVLVDGRWMTEEQGYEARGYVKYQGEWMTRGEAQAQEASYQASRDAERRAIDAEAAALRAEQAAEQAAREAESDAWSQYDDPLLWGGWGYGVTYWPSTPNRPNRPNAPNRPATLPARAPAGGRR
ncbi:MAG: hypothetical protein MUE47_03285 [Acidobacteria bacterium]|nr:hypothetical protein [Acidobacteriota bacterium]